ncbi:uncharacterized protein LOC131674002 [Phymastichus coffea]|uniref:uncharacterized protein LOC131674002 n=1 Tax=Phymastichus coffea TaxID=108790 RepID=UPI00273AD581|nr:uncharacterized protein LOC131674002 [Phymastichus coffea]
MFFYFLGLVLALVTIFGIVHLQPANEYLHLQNFCVWSSSTVRRQLQKYNLFGFQENNDGANDIVNVIEISLTQVEVPEYENASALEEPIEEIQNIKLGDERVVEGANAIPNLSTLEAQAQPSRSRDSVLSAINASLRRLSSVANSGRINGAQLYQILLRETLMHEQSARAEDTDLSSTPSNNTVTLEAVTEDENNIDKPKVKMYFGDAPMEYVPHQK